MLYDKNPYIHLPINNQEPKEPPVTVLEVVGALIRVVAWVSAFVVICVAMISTEPKDGPAAVVHAGGGTLTVVESTQLSESITAKIVKVRRGGRVYTYLVVSNWRGGVELKQLSVGFE